MSAICRVILTEQGLQALRDAELLGTKVKPKYFKFSTLEEELEPEWTELQDTWIQKDISAYIPINDNIAEFVCDVKPEAAVEVCGTTGLYLEDGTLFMLAKPPWPMPADIRQTLKIQLVFQNVQELVDFQYIPFSETEQDLSILEVSSTLGYYVLQNTLEISLIKQYIGGSL